MYNKTILLCLWALLMALPIAQGQKMEGGTLFEDFLPPNYEEYGVAYGM